MLIIDVGDGIEAMNAYGAIDTVNHEIAA